MLPLSEILTQLLNRYLTLDPYAATLQQPLYGHTICIQARPLPRPYYLTFSADKITVSAVATSASATITGGLFNLALLQTQPHKMAALKTLGVTVEGNLAIANAFQHFFANIYIDWEEQLARYLGDPLAVFLGKTTHLVKRALSHTTQSLRQNTQEYLQEEGLFLPCKRALDDWMNEVDTLQLDVERLKLRIQQLQDTLT